MVNLYKSPHVRHVTDEDGSMVLLNLRTGKYTFLNAAAGRVWQHLSECGGTVERALGVVAPSLGVTVERFTSDMAPLIAKWQCNHILTTKELKK